MMNVVNLTILKKLEHEPEDIWIQSRLSKLISEVTESMEKMRLRESLHHILYGFDSELQWYMKRANAKNRNDISGVLNKILTTRISMLSPFAPHIAEEMWEKLGNSEMVSKTSWPKQEEQQTIHQYKMKVYLVQ